jgi:hypothetical protein
MLRARTLAQYRDREGRGGVFIAVWRRAAPLQQLLDLRVALLRDLEDPIHVEEDGLTVRLGVIGAVEVAVYRLARGVRLRYLPVPPRADDYLDYEQRDETSLDPAGWLHHWCLIRTASRSLWAWGPDFIGDWLAQDADVVTALRACGRRLAAHPALPQEAVALAQAAYGPAGVRCMHVSTVTWSWNHPVLYRELLAKAPHLVNVMPAVHMDLGEDDAPATLADLRRWMLDRGMTTGGWRWLARAGAGLNIAEELLKSGYVAADIPLLANVMAAAAAGGTFAPSAAFTSEIAALTRWAEVPDMALERSPWLLRAAWRFCSDSRADQLATRSFLWERFVALARWAVARGWQPDAHQRQAGWRAFELAMARSYAWPVPFKEVTCGGLQAVCIRNGTELRREGRAMSHCIFDYLDSVAGGGMIAFSVRLAADGSRLATLSLTRKNDSAPWVFDQCRGPRNSVVAHSDLKGLIGAVLRHLGART